MEIDANNGKILKSCISSKNEAWQMTKYLQPQISQTIGEGLQKWDSSQAFPRAISERVWESKSREQNGVSLQLHFGTVTCNSCFW